MAIWSILWPFGMFCGHFGPFSRFGKLYLEKIWQTRFSVNANPKTLHM
jgi:hypothetical protein